MGQLRPTSITTHFAALPDLRVERTKAHLLLDIISIALCTVHCSGEGWAAMETFGRTKEAWLRTFLALPHGIPSRDTFGRVFAHLDPVAFGRCFAAWAGAVAPDHALPASAPVVAVDGKTLRRSHDRANGKRPSMSRWWGRLADRAA